MTSPLDKMILGAAKCTVCGAGYGQCNCWSRCPKCRCMYETGKTCRRCDDGSLKVVAMNKPRRRKPTTKPQSE